MTEITSLSFNTTLDGSELVPIYQGSGWAKMAMSSVVFTDTSGYVNFRGHRGGSGSVPGSGNFKVYADAAGGWAYGSYDTQDYNAFQFVRDVSGVATQCGTIRVNVSSVTYNTTSDRELKDDDGQLSYDQARAILRLIIIHRFRWKATGTEDIGAFAQELYEVYPAAVSRGGWWDAKSQSWSDVEIEGVLYSPWGVDYSKLVPIIIPVVEGNAVRLDALEALVKPASSGGF
jgi:hypothetical protein